jgi:hypothetical protein
LKVHKDHNWGLFIREFGKFEGSDKQVFKTSAAADVNFQIGSDLEFDEIFRRDKGSNTRTTNKPSVEEKDA